MDSQAGYDIIYIKTENESLCYNESVWNPAKHKFTRSSGVPTIQRANEFPSKHL